MRKVLVLAIAIGLLLAGATVASADPNVPNIGPHRHFVKLPSLELVQVGPRLCDDPSLQQAFNQFHINVHHSGTSPFTSIDTLGPQHGAPGLHNLKGAELIAGRC